MSQFSLRGFGAILLCVILGGSVAAQTPAMDAAMFDKLHRRALANPLTARILVEVLTIFGLDSSAGPTPAKQLSILRPDVEYSVTFSGATRQTSCSL